MNRKLAFVVAVAAAVATWVLVWQRRWLEAVPTLVVFVLATAMVLPRPKEE